MGRVATTVSVGLSLIGLALVVLLYEVPNLVFSAVPSLAAMVRSLDPSFVVLGAGLLLGSLSMLRWLFIKLFGSRVTPDRPKSSAAQQSLYGTGGDLPTFGTGFQTQFERATTYDGVDEADRREARDDVVDALRTMAAAAYAQSAGVDADGAGDAVARGDWTDDRRAAGLLATDEGPSVPTRLWLLDLLLGRDPFVESVEHAVAAIAALNGDERYVRGASESATGGSDEPAPGVSSR